MQSKRDTTFETVFEFISKVQINMLSQVVGTVCRLCEVRIGVA